MNHLRALALVALLALPACGILDRMAPSTSPSPVAVAASPAATAEVPAGWKRFAAADYRIDYPESLHFDDSMETKQAVAEEVDRQGIEVSAAGQQFFLLMNEPGTGTPFNPNLNLVFEDVPADAGELTQDEYLRLSREGVETMLQGGRIVEDLDRVDIGGLEWGTLVYDFSMSGFDLRGKAFAHYDPERRRGYVLTMTDVRDGWQKSFPTFEKIIRTFRLDP